MPQEGLKLSEKSISTGAFSQIPANCSIKLVEKSHFKNGKYTSQSLFTNKYFFSQESEFVFCVEKRVKNIAYSASEQVLKQCFKALL